MREEPLNNEGWDRPVPSCGLYARYAVMFLVLEQLRWWETWGCMDNIRYGWITSGRWSGGSQMLIARLPEGG